MIEVLNMPSGEIAVTLDQRFLAAAPAHDHAAATLLAQVVENLSGISNIAVVTPKMTKPLVNGDWQAVIEQRRGEWAMELQHMKAALDEADIVLAQTDDETGWMVGFSGDEPQTDEVKSVDTNIFDSKEEAVWAAYNCLLHLRTLQEPADAPAA